MVGKSDLFEHLGRGKRVLYDLVNELYIFMHGERRDQIVKLKYESDLFGAVFGKLIVRQRGYIPTVNYNFPFSRAVKSAEQIEKRAFSRSRRSENYDKLTVFQLHVNFVKCSEFVIAACVNAAHSLKFGNCHWFPPPFPTPVPSAG